MTEKEDQCLNWRRECDIEECDRYKINCPDYFSRKEFKNQINAQWVNPPGWLSLDERRGY